MLQFITNSNVLLSPVQQIEQAIAGGCRWIQIRMKQASDAQVAEVAKKVKPLCLKTNSILLLDDRVQLAKELDLGGVHLGQSDMHPAQARRILGPAAIIGVTANTFQHIKKAASLDIDYIGVGPFRHTDTKKNLAPLLGKSGIADIVHKMQLENIDVPVVAIGGIIISDIPDLMQTGINGIAVSAAIAAAQNPAIATAKILQRLQACL